MFFVIEGIDACGKDTVLAKLRESEMLKDAIFTREPGGTPQAERIRALMLETANDLEPNTEAILAFAARAEHIAKVIKPAHREKKTVVSSRYYQSTMAYQCAAGASSLLIRDLINRLVPTSASPNMTILIDIPVSVSFQRKAQRNLVEEDVIEQRSLRYFNNVRLSYLEQAMDDPRTLILRGTASREEVIEAVASAIHWVKHERKAPLHFEHALRPSATAVRELIAELKHEINGIDGL